MKSIFEAEAYQEITARLEKITENSDRQWGKMDAAQMLAHCNQSLGTLLGEIPSQGGANFLIRWFFKKSLYSDKLYGKNLPTGKGFAMKEAKDFAAEKARLIAYLQEAHARGEAYDWAPHPAFGQYTGEQNGKAVYKHLDHHFRQFGT